jgi:DNA polymerase-3 subunit epsilon
LNPENSAEYIDTFGEGALRRDAARALLNQPLTSAQLVQQVCNMPGVPAGVADDIALALLGNSPWFRRDSAGTWSLVSEPDRSQPADAGTRKLVSPATPLSQLGFLVVDVESTGTSMRFGHRIIEVAAYLLEGDQITRVVDTLVNPRRPIPYYVTRLTGITREMLFDAPAFTDCSKTMADAMKGRVFVAHNVQFDWAFVTAELDRTRDKPPPMPLLCTVKLARALLRGLPRRSLDRLARYLGVKIENRHRAGGDARATARVLRHMLQIAADQGVRNWGDLSNLARTRGGRRRHKQ